MPKVKVTGQRSKSCLSNNSKTTEPNFTKFHRKIEHNEKVCHAQVRFLCPRSEPGQNCVSAIAQKLPKQI